MLLGGKQKFTVNRGKVNACSILKTISGDEKRHVISRDTVNRGITVACLRDLILESFKG